MVVGVVGWGIKFCVSRDVKLWPNGDCAEPDQLALVDTECLK